jgi:hypothetical protein
VTSTLAYKTTVLINRMGKNLFIIKAQGTFQNY